MAKKSDRSARVAYARYYSKSDESTCQSCQDLDGHAWLPDAKEIANPPFNHCSSPRGCRCRVQLVLSNELGANEIAEFIKDNGGLIAPELLFQVKKFLADKLSLDYCWKCGYANTGNGPQCAKCNAHLKPDADPAEPTDSNLPDRDEKFADAFRVSVREKRITVTTLQRKLAIGNEQARTLLAQLERDGVLTPRQGNRAQYATDAAIKFYLSWSYMKGHSIPVFPFKEMPEDSTESKTKTNTRNSAEHERSPFEVLQVRPHASPDQIRSAYRRLVSQYHPDKVANLAPEYQEIAETRIKEINAAYRALVK